MGGERCSASTPRDTSFILAATKPLGATRIRGVTGMIRIGRQVLRGAFVAAAALALYTPQTQAADHVRVAKSVDVAWAFIPLDVGIQEGIFAKYNLDVEGS